MLNTENNDVNNLDLNDDGQIDYVRVVDRMDGDVHAIVLQVPVSASESMYTPPKPRLPSRANTVEASPRKKLRWKVNVAVA